MKTSAILCAVLATAAIAQPHQHGNKRRHVHGKHQKRALVTEWVTETAYVTEYVDSTTTYWVGPDDSATPSAAPTTSAPGQFFEPGETPAASPTTLTTSTKPAAPVPSVKESVEQAPAPSPSTTSTPAPAPQPTTTAQPVVQPSTSVYVAPPPAPTTTSTPLAQPSATPQPSSGSGSGGGTGGDVHNGDLTFYAVGLGACGYDDSGKDKTEGIVAISAALMGTVSNGNPMCGKKVKITVNGKSTTATVRDKCMGCEPEDIDVSEKTFLEMFDNLDVGRKKVSWSFLD